MRETTSDGLFSLDTLRCVGACGLAPVVTIGGKVYGRATPEKVRDILQEYFIQAEYIRSTHQRERSERQSPTPFLFLCSYRLFDTLLCCTKRSPYGLLYSFNTIMEMNAMLSDERTIHGQIPFLLRESLLIGQNPC